MPCKGIDIRFDETLEAVKKQSYTECELVAVVDSESDPAYSVLARHGIKTIISDPELIKTTSCSGKNRAVMTALSLHSEAFELFVVVDSDTTVGTEWLGALIMPLAADDRVGVSTTFPLFYPLGGFWSMTKTVWGLVGSSMQNDRRTRFVWGGSMAFRSKLVKTALVELSRSTADDIAIGKACKELGMDIVSVPRARPIVYVKETFGTFSEWSVRQTALSILGNRRLFKYGVAYYALFCVNDFALLYAAYAHSILAVLFAIPILLNILGFCLATGFYNPIYYLIVAFMPIVYLVDLVLGRLKKNIRWRGADYKLA
jgi:cellulose synthase/poly-beta-1,6-N-acetylglucosamine synthase-like glycosyltransferase